MKSSFAGRFKLAGDGYYWAMMTTAGPKEKHPQEIYNGWVSTPTKRVMVVDEARFPTAETGVAGERLVYMVTCQRSSAVVQFIHDVHEYRQALDAQKRGMPLKAKKVFTTNAHKKLQDLVKQTLASVEFVLSYATSTQHLAQIHADAVGPTAKVIDGSVVDGPEMRMLQLIIKYSANQWQCQRPENIDVVVDRSSQLGLTLTQRGKAGHKGFEAFDIPSGELNFTSTGARAQVTSKASFRLICVGEETKEFGDVLLFADSAAYICRAKIKSQLADSRLDAGLVPFARSSGLEFVKHHAPG